METTYDRRLVFVLPDGRLNVVSIMMQPNETFESCVTVELEKIQRNFPDMAALPYFIKTKQEIVDGINLHPERQKRSLRCDAMGNFYHDMAYKHPEEIRLESSAAIKIKLMNGEKLTAEEADFVLGE